MEKPTRDFRTTLSRPTSTFGFHTSHLPLTNMASEHPLTKHNFFQHSNLGVAHLDSHESTEVRGCSPLSTSNLDFLLSTLALLFGTNLKFWNPPNTLILVYSHMQGTFFFRELFREFCGFPAIFSFLRVV